MRTIFGLKMIFFCLLLLSSNNNSLAQDWIVTSEEVVEDSTITLEGDLIIKNGGSLTLKQVTLEVNCHYDGEYKIEVETGGIMFIYNNSKIIPSDLNFKFAFAVHGSAFEMKNSELHGCGWGPDQELGDNDAMMSGANGILIATDNAIIEGNTFSNNYVGIILADSAITFNNNTIHSNTVHGIYIAHGKDCLISNNHIQHGGNASSPFRISSGFNNKIVGNTIISSIHRGIIEASESDGNLFEDNTISGLGVGMSIFFTSNNNVIRGNKITVDECGLWIWGWNNTIENNTISGGISTIDTGIYLVYSYNSVIADNTLSGIGDLNGIWLRHSSNNKIANNQVTASHIPDYTNSFGLLLNNYSKHNIVQDNIYSGFTRGIGLFYSSDSNKVYRNESLLNEFQGMVIDDSHGNIIYSNNKFEDNGKANFDNGQNMWNYEGALPEIHNITPPVYNNIFSGGVTSEKIIENQTINLGWIDVQNGGSLTLRNVTVITGGSGRNSSLQVGSGGSLFIYNCKFYHLENGNGFTLSTSNGSIFKMKDSELYTSGDEWWYGGIDLASDNIEIENNLISDTMLRLSNCSNGRIIGNKIYRSYMSIMTGGCKDITIANNIISGSISEPLRGGGDNITVKDNIFSESWAGINIWEGNNHLFEGNNISGIKDKRIAIHLEGNNAIATDNIISNCYMGISMELGHTALNNKISNCNIGLRTGWGNNRIESNTISNCDLGVYLFRDDNKVFNNTIANCDTGLIAGGGTSNNILYQNNFIDNLVQAKEDWPNNWDYRGTGNYWSDYSGVDANNDGIGDTPYDIIPNIIDHYPLMQAVPSIMDAISVKVTPFSYSYEYISPGDTNVVIEKIALQLSPDDTSDVASWQSIRMDKIGTGVDSDVAQIEIWRDDNDNEQLDADLDTEIGSGIFEQGKANIMFSSFENMSNIPKNYFIAIDISENISNIGNTIGIKCLDSTYFSFRFPATVLNNNFPFQSDETTLPVENEIDIPNTFSLGQNYPNPFNPTTTIKYDLPKFTFVTLKVFNITGQLVATLVNEQKNAGRYSVTWNAENLSSGVYYYRITAGNFSDVKKCIILK